MTQSSEQFISRYEIISILGQGGTGTVYRAMDPYLRKTVAIKVINAITSSDEAIVRFQNEAKTLQKIRNAAIPEVYTFGVSDNNQPYIVMEYMEGVSIREKLTDDGFIEPKAAIEIAKKVCEVLAYSHSNGVFHRDLKPENIILEEGEKDPAVKVIDFGLAKLESLTKEDIQYLTKTGKLVGSPPYMSPEQINAKSIDGRSDIYALGCVLYEMLTGEIMFGGDSSFAIINKHLSGAPPKLEGFSEELGDMIAKCVAKSPEGRFQNMLELKEALSEPSVFADEEEEEEDSIFTYKPKVITFIVLFAVIVIISVPSLLYTLQTTVYDKANKELPKVILEDEKLKDSKKLAYKADTRAMVQKRNGKVEGSFDLDDDYLINHEFPKARSYKFRSTITAKGLKMLPKDVIELVFERGRIDQETWKFITTEFKELRKLTLMRTHNLPPKSLADMKNLKHLTTLVFLRTKRGSTTYDDVKELVKVKSLFSLVIQGKEIDAKCIRELHKLPNLISLYLTEMMYDDDIAKEVSTLKKLRLLSITKCQFSENAFKPIGKMNLVKLNIQKSLTIDDFKNIEKIKTLKTLGLHAYPNNVKFIGLFKSLKAKVRWVRN